MSDVTALVVDNLDIWTSAIERKSGAGRGGGKRISLYGIERLRTLILDLALLGKLVPQDASDEPAGLSLVRARKNLAAKAGDIRRLRWKPSTPFSEKESQTPLPRGWELARVNDTGFYINGLAFKPDDWSDAGRPIIRIQNLTNPSTPYNYTVGDFPDEVVVRDGDLLVSWSATLAAFQWSGEDAILNQHIFRVIHEPALTERAYLRLQLQQAIAEMAESDHAHGLVMTHINRGPFLDHLVMVPPLAEQRRIVAKVDELLALCVALERESADTMAAHQTLVETLLATLVNSADAAALAANWARLEGHFDTLFTTEASIDALKQTVLGLAVRGKLAEQDPEDGSATELLSQIEKQKRELLRDGQIKKSKPLEAIDPARAPFPIPSNWAWQRLGDVAFLVTDGEHLTPKRIDDPDGVPLVTAKNVRAGAMDYSVTDFVSRETAEVCWRRCRPEKNDILVVSVGATIGRHTIVDDFREMVIVRSVTLIKADHAVVPYLSCVIGSEMMQRQIWGGVRQSAQPCLYLNVSNALQVPIPPLAEQHRIVAKVDELMALCDALKARLVDAAETRRHLADAFVERSAA